MSQGLDAIRLGQHAQNRLHIDAGWSEQGFAEGFARRERRGVRPGERSLLNDFAHQRKSVGMKTRGAQAKDMIARLDVRSRQEFAAFDRADREAREVVIGAGVKPWHLGGFAADQRRARLDAALRDALDDLRPNRGIELSGREIIEKKKRLGTLHDEVVDTHGDEIDPDCVVNAGRRGNFDLGADSIVGGDENRIGKTRRLEIENSAEAADFGIRAGPPCGAHERLDLFDHGIAGIDIDAGTGIGEAMFIFHIDPVPTPRAREFVPVSRNEKSAR